MSGTSLSSNLLPLKALPSHLTIPALLANTREFAQSVGVSTLGLSPDTQSQFMQLSSRLRSKGFYLKITRNNLYLWDERGELPREDDIDEALPTQSDDSLIQAYLTPSSRE